MFAVGFKYLTEDQGEKDDAKASVTHIIAQHYLSMSKDMQGKSSEELTEELARRVNEDLKKNNIPVEIRLDILSNNTLEAVSEVVDRMFGGTKDEQPESMTNPNIESNNARTKDVFDKLMSDAFMQLYIGMTHHNAHPMFVLPASATSYVHTLGNTILNMDGVTTNPNLLRLAQLMFRASFLYIAEHSINIDDDCLLKKLQLNRDELLADLHAVCGREGDKRYMAIATEFQELSAMIVAKDASTLN